MSDIGDRRAYYDAVSAHYDAKGEGDLNFLSSRDGLVVHHHSGLFEDGAVPDLDDGEALLHALGASEDRVVERAAAMLRLAPGERGLDCGCGRGGSSFLFAKNHGVSMEGITISSAQHTFASDAAQRLGLGDRARFYLENVYERARPAAHYDFVWACESACYMHDRPALFEEWRRVLRGTGARVGMFFYGLVESRADEFPRELEAIFDIYAGRLPSTAEYLGAAHGAGFAVDDLVTLDREVLPYWKLRKRTKHARGSEDVLIRLLEGGGAHVHLAVFRPRA